MLQIRPFGRQPLCWRAAEETRVRVFSAWLQTAAPWGPTDPGAKGRGGRQTVGCDEHLLALSPLFLSHSLALLPYP